MTFLPADKPVGLRLWLTGIRPRTLTIALSPVIGGAGLAFFNYEVINWPLLAVTLLCALAIQAGTNLYNDAADGLRGHDTVSRLGPPRLTALGWANPQDVKRAALTSFGIAVLGGLYLIYSGGWPILLIGTLSIMCGYAYSTGPLPVSRTPLGEVFVVAFFGVAAVGGTYYLQTGTISANALIAGIIIGLFAAAVLMINNCRDMTEDRLSGRKTLALVAGLRFSMIIYSLLILAPFVLQFANETRITGAGNWLPLLTLPFALLLIWRFQKAQNGEDFNMLLVQTAKLQLAFSMLFALGLVTLTLEQVG